MSIQYYIQHAPHLLKTLEYSNEAHMQQAGFHIGYVVRWEEQLHLLGAVMRLVTIIIEARTQF